MISPYSPIHKAPRFEGTRNAPLFTGATRQLRGRHWLSGEGMDRYLGTLKTPYIGKPPKALLNALGVKNPKPFYELLDATTVEIRRHTPSRPRLLTLEHPDFPAPVQFKYLGSGGYGTAYKMQVGEFACVVKIYHHGGMPDISNEWRTKKGGHGNMAEAATAIFLAGLGIGEVADFYAANPEAGWAMMELITPDKTLNGRPEKRLSDIDVTVRDIAGNSINYVYFDYGALLPPISVEKFKSLIPEQQESLIHFELLRAMDRLEGFRHILNSHPPQYFYYRRGDMEKLFSIMPKHDQRIARRELEEAMDKAGLKVF